MSDNDDVLELLLEAAEIIEDQEDTMAKEHGNGEIDPNSKEMAFAKRLREAAMADPHPLESAYIHGYNAAVTRIQTELRTMFDDDPPPFPH